MSGVSSFHMPSGRTGSVVQCRSRTEKLAILAKKRELASTAPDGSINKVYLDDDLPKEDREAQRAVRAIAKEKRAQGCNVAVAFKKLRIDGKWMIFDEESGKLREDNFRRPDKDARLERSGSQGQVSNSNGLP